MKNLILIAFLAFAIIQSSNATGPKDSPLGVSTSPMDESVINNPKTKIKNGVVVTEVGANTIADDLGLKKDDVIHAVNGQDIINADQLAFIINRISEGSMVEVSIIRNGKDRTLTCTVHRHA